MQYSVVNYKTVRGTETLRFDAEYYQSEYLHIFNLIKEKNKRFIALNQLKIKCDASAFYPTLEPYYGQGDIPFVRVADVDDGINYEKILTIPKQILEEYKTLNLGKKGDIVLTKGGSIARAGLVTKDSALTRDLIFFNTSKLNEIDYIFYYVYCLTEFYKKQLVQSSSMTAQPHLTITLVKNIPFFNPNEDFKRIVISIFKKQAKLLDQSKSFYTQAEQLLLAELGLLDWKPKHKLIFVKNYSDTQKAERIDAEYFQPKYEEIIEAVKKYKGGYETLDNLSKLIGHPSNPPYEINNTENKTFIITQKHLANYFPADNFWKDEKALYTTDEFIAKNKKFILQKNDIILYSVGAYIGKANLYNAEIKATIGSFLTLIRPDLKKINPYYLLVYLNSKIGQELTRRNSRGLAQQYIYPYDTKQVIVPILGEKMQKEIEKLILGGQNSQKLSRSLLEIAKRGVEMAIEKDEQAAEKWINNELEKIKIKL